jgi:uncharacterized membrane protein
LEGREDDLGEGIGMRKSTRRKTLAMGILALLVLGMSTVVQGEGDQVSFTAIVYESDGTLVGSEFDGTKATVVVIDLNTGEENEYETVLEAGHVITSIPADVISNSKIRIKIDGGGWGDADYFVHAKEDMNDLDIVIVEGAVSGAIGTHDVQTYKYIPMNLKPIIALIFIILILLFGYLFLGAMNRQKLNVVVTEKDRVKLKTKQGLKETYKYTCGYGEEDDIKEIGEFHDDRDFPEASLLKMTARKVMKMPDGTYTWYNPKAVDMSKLAKDKLPTEPDTEERVDKRWFQGGSLTPRKGQTMKSASQRYTHRLFVAFVYPFFLIELMLGVGSIWIESLQFPPSIWILIINILVLVFAMIFQIAWFSKSTKEEKPEEKPEEVTETETPEKLEEMKPLKAEAEEPVVKEEPAEVIEEKPAEEPVKEAAEEPAVAPAAAPTTPEQAVCPNCGQDIGADFVVCPFCGEAIK